MNIIQCKIIQTYRTKNCKTLNALRLQKTTKNCKNVNHTYIDFKKEKKNCAL